MGCPTFADDLTLLELFPSFLQHLMSIVFNFSIKWRYEFNHTKSGVVVFGESKIQHAKNMMSRKFNLGLDVVKERKEYKNLGVTKNYADSCSGDIEETIKKARRKGGMIHSMGFDRKKVTLPPPPPPPPQFIINYGSKLASLHLCLAPNFGLSAKLILLVLSAVRIGLLEKCLIYPNFPVICFYSNFWSYIS